MSSEPTRPRRSALFTAYLLLCNCLVCFILLELGARATLRLWRWWHGTPSIGAGYGEDLHPWFQNANYPGPVVDPGPDFAGWVIDPPRVAGGDARCRILFLGGSTMAYDLPRMTRETMEREGVKTRAYNLAAPWHCSLHSLYKFWTYVDEVRPDLVVVLENVNDFYRGFTPPALALHQYRPDYSHYAGGLNPFVRPAPSSYDGRPVFSARAQNQDDASVIGALRQILRDSTLVVRARQVLVSLSRPRPVARPMPPEEYLRSLPAFRRNMENLKLGCASKGVPVLFLTMPFTTRSGRFLSRPGLFFTNDGQSSITDPDFESGMREFNRAVLALASERSPVLDLAAEITDPEMFVDEAHLTLTGKQQEATRISAFVRAHGLLGSCPQAAAQAP